MKKLFFFLSCIALLNNQLFAVPAYPNLIDYKHPDGTTITIRLMGDEKVNWAETSDGYSILLNKDGFYEYTMLNEENDMVRTGIRAFNHEDRSNSEKIFLNTINKGIRFSESQVHLMKQIWQINEKELAKAFPTTGNRKLICILMGFKDLAFTKTKAEFEALFNQVGYTTGGATGSVKDYYIENSYNQFNLTVDVAGPYTASENMSYYGGSSGTENPRPLISEAINFADADVNYTNYDNDNDGWVDGVYVIYAGYGKEAGGPTGSIWAHAWQLASPVLKDGVYLQRYSCSAELRSNSGSNITRIGVICHEFGHVLGAPDYYDTNYETGGQFSGTGQWDMMANGSWNNSGATPAHHNGFTKVYYYNWATATTLNSPSSITLYNAAQNTNSFYRINTTTTNEYFLVEYREKFLFDSYIPGSGMIIYHVHSGVFSVGNSINATHPQRMYPVAQNATSEPSSTPSSYGTINAATCAWTGTGKNAFTDTSVPSSKSWAGANTDKPITNILYSSANKTVTFDIMGGYAENPTLFTATAVSTSQINLSWNKYQGKDVLLIFNNTGIFGEPQNGTNYTAGQSIPGGGTVIYAGAGESFAHTGLNHSTKFFYKIFTKLTTPSTWSTGVSTNATTLCNAVTTFPFTEDFNATTLLPTCWEIVDNQGGGQVWQFGTHSSGLTGTTGNYAFLNSDGFGSGNSQNADLITPPLNLSSFTEVTLSFKHYFRSYTGSSAKLFYSINGGSTWIQIQQWTSTSSNPTTFSQAISNVAGQANVKFKWNYTGTYGYYWDIDDVQVNGIESPKYAVNLSSFPSGIGVILTGNADYSAGENVTISASALSGFVFDGWSGEAIDLALLDDPSSTQTSFVMPARVVNLSANYRKILSLTGIVAQNRVYDGTTQVVIDNYGELVGLLNPSHNVNLVTDNADAYVATKGIGSGKAVTISNLELSGTDKSMYIIYNQQTTVTITAKSLDVINATADKVYDGTNQANILNSELSGVIIGDDVVLENHTAGTFTQSNVGNSIIVETEMSITGTDALNYSLNQPNILANITPRNLTIAAVDIAKALGVSYNFTGNEFTIDGLLNNDRVNTVILSSDGAAHDAITGTYIIDVNDAEGIGLSNYTINYLTGTLSVTDKTELSLSEIVVNSKVYDGTKDASISIWGSLTGKQDEDEVLLVSTNYIAVFNDKNAGNGKVVSVYGLSLSGADASKYFIGPQTSTASIYKKGLTVTNAQVTGKVYDGNNSAIITGAMISGAIAFDEVELTNHTAGTFAQVDAGNAIAVATSMQLAGNDANNYTLAQPSLTAKISPKIITLSGNFTASNKLYDGLTAASISSNSLSVNGIISSDNISLVPNASFESKIVGNDKLVYLTGETSLTGPKSGNYQLSLTGAPTATASISAKTITVNNATAESKVYDSSNAANIAGAQIDGVIAGDDVRIAAISGVFAQQAIGSNIPVSVETVLAGFDSNNYTVNEPQGLTASITAKEISLKGSFSVVDKVYDGTSVAQVNLTGIVISGLITGDNVTVVPTADFETAEVGSNIKVSLRNETHISGDDAENYTLNLIGAPVSTGKIVAKPLYVGGSFTATSKIYDGSTTANMGNNLLVINGVVEDDDVILVPVLSFSDKKVGDNKIVHLSSQSNLIGEKAKNYSLSLSGAPTSSASIIPKQLQLSGNFTVNDKIYDGTILAQGLSNNLTLWGIVSNDVVTFNPIFVFDNKNVGNSKDVFISDLSVIQGNDSGNYYITFGQTPTTKASIMQREVFINGSFTAFDKVYDGTTLASIESNNLYLETVIDNDDAAISLVEVNFNDPEIGENKPVTITSASIAGVDSPNYSLSIEGAPLAYASILQPVTAPTGSISEIRIYPNPFTNSFSINGVNTFTRIEMFNLIGQKIWETTSQAIETITIETNSIPAGVYLIKLTDRDNKTSVRRVVKE